jgi:hypothetical protein
LINPSTAEAVEVIPIMEPPVGIHVKILRRKKSRNLPASVP